MIVTVHQPHFLPWLGYLDRMLQADLFIVLDHVQFERRNYQNRTRILLEGKPHWLTVPVMQHSQQERVIDKQIDNPQKVELRWWGSSHFQTLRHAYRKAPYFDTYAPVLRKILESRWDRLVDLDQALLDYLRDILGIRTPLVSSAELGVGGHRSELMLNICQAVNADTFIIGMGASRDYLDRQAFSDAGIEVVNQVFEHPQYVQCGGGPFVPGLSSLDLIFNHGPESREILRGEALACRSTAA
jgi:hypothetical protein